MKQKTILLLVFFLLCGSYQVLFATQNIPIDTLFGKPYYKYEVLPKETLYSLCKRFQVSQEELTEINPFLSEGLKIGQVLTIPVRVQVNMDNAQQEAESGFYYQVQKWREDIDDIAKNHGISTEELRADNPNIPTKLSRNSIVWIPLATKSVRAEDETNQEFTINNSLPADQVLLSEEDMDSGTQTIGKDKISIGILLPFMLDDTTGISTERYVEFYEGFLLAVDSLKSAGISIDIHTFDIGNTVWHLQRTLSGNPSLLSTDFLVAAATAEQMPELSQWAIQEKKKLILPFSSRIQETETNPYIYQINPPHHQTYSKLLRSLDTTVFSGKNILLLRSAQESHDERYNLFRDLKIKLKDNHIPYREVLSFEQNVYVDSLANYIDLTTENIFIPAPMSLNESNRIITNVTAALKLSPKAKACIYGYPEWMALNKNNLPQLHALNACIYNTYYADFQSKEVRDFQLLYNKTFGKDLLNTFPRYALMAYDIAMYFIPKTYGLDRPFLPLQNPMSFKAIGEQSGQYNQSLFLIRYETNRSVTASLIP